MNSAHKKPKKAIKKQVFFPLRADQTPTEGSKQVFAKMPPLPFADPILPHLRGSSLRKKTPPGKNRSPKHQHKEHQISVLFSKFPNSPKFSLPLKIIEIYRISANRTPFFPG